MARLKRKRGRRVVVWRVWDGGAIYGWGYLRTLRMARETAAKARRFGREVRIQGLVVEREIIDG
jgi:hypothetical protein